MNRGQKANHKISPKGNMRDVLKHGSFSLGEGEKMRLMNGGFEPRGDCDLVESMDRAQGKRFEKYVSHPVLKNERKSCERKKIRLKYKAMEK